MTHGRNASSLVNPASRRGVMVLVLSLAGCRPVPSNPPEVWIPRDAATTVDTEPADEVWIPRADAAGSGLSYESPTGRTADDDADANARTPSIAQSDRAH